MLLKGKNAVITGCLKGIGRSTMDLFAENGANIWACCQHEDPEFESHIKELAAKNNVWITPLYFDLLDPDQVKSAAHAIRDTKQPVDVLVNIAGMTHDALFHMTTMEQMKKVFEVNFFSQMLLSQFITRYMLRQKSGSVINISSISAIDGNPGQLSYSASKAAIIGATKTLSAELAGSGIRVNAIAPGVIKTEMTEKMPADVLARLMVKSDLKHMGLPEEVAGVILFLASDMSSFITGQIIRVDGGIG
ncbi:SDR family oxidoreductase [uncultured Methanoregula sp.]|uniref:SDR family NAD(P)-dependent oxidoreductase n=1 Tax=uncultured Methanoregula sp. TaxID=1005933 RepID=UPI002AAB5FEB|nr:SDR family oxidoreductase [uncultured Methanoregula sp.]